ncbi:MAG: glycosyltransferase [Deltaproteobacteria bacterium]|nr:glycosyltransferase [Deltaproteobacteria bacterium]
MNDLKIDSVALIVLNYNGADLLNACLPSIIKASHRSRYRCRIIILDNCSQDQSKEIVRTHFPEADWVSASENRVLCSYNPLMKELSEEIVILLNNDISVEPDFIDPLVDVFEQHPDAFFAAPKVLLPGTKKYEGNRTQMRMRWGIFEATCFFPGHEKGIDQPGYTLQTGYGAFHRLRFLELGGYDDLYLPGRVEDSDICFRAWRRGYRGFYVPSSIVYHEGAVTFRKVFGQKKMDTLTCRNIFLFMWKNLKDPRLLFEHLFFLFPRLSYALLKGNTPFALGFFLALQKAPEAWKRRRAQRIYPAIRRDCEIFEMVR